MKLFRTAVIGGYNREEVDDCFSAMTEELERLKTVVAGNQEKDTEAEDKLRKELEAEKAEKQNLLKKIGEDREERQNLLGKIDAGQAEKQDLLRRIEELQAQEQQPEQERQELEAAKVSLEEERQQLEAAKAQFGAEKEQLEAAREQFGAEKAQLEIEKAQLEAEKRELEEEHQKAAELMRELAELKEQRPEQEKQPETGEEEDKAAPAGVDPAYVAELEKKVEKYERSYVYFADFMEDARQEASNIVETAQKDAQAYQQNAEAEIAAQKEEQSKNYMVAKYKLMEYIDSVNDAQSRLIGVYNELGSLVNRMPLQLKDVFSESPMELLADRKEDGGEGQENSQNVVS